MTAKVTIYKHKTLADGSYPIVVILRQGNKRKIRSFTMSVFEDEWDFDLGTLKVVRPCNPKHKNWEKYQRYRTTNDFITSKQAGYDKKIHELHSLGKPFTIEKLIQAVEGKTIVYNTFFTFWQGLLDDYEKTGQMGQYRTEKDARNRFKEYLAGKDVMFYEIDQAMLLAYREYLSRRMGKASIKKHLSAIRKVYNLAIAHSVAKAGDYPFGRHSKIMEGLKAAYNSQSLTRAQIDKMRSLGSDKIPEGDNYLWHARNFFIFMYVGHGHNIGDLARFKWSDIAWEQKWVKGRLHYIRYKNRNKHPQMGSFSLTPELIAILKWYRVHWRSLRQLANPYIFPIFNGWHNTPKRQDNRMQNSIRRINEALKTIGGMIDADIRITTYTARHSAANQLVRAGESPVKIQQIMRHASIQTTQHYLQQFDNEDIDRAISNL